MEPGVLARLGSPIAHETVRGWRKIAGPEAMETSLQEKARVHNLLASGTMGEIRSYSITRGFIVIEPCWYWICRCI